MRQEMVLGMFGQNSMESKMRFVYDYSFSVREFVEIVAEWKKKGNVFMKIDARKIMGFKSLGTERSTYIDEPYPVDKMFAIVAKCRLEGIPLEDHKLEIIQLAM